MANKVILAVAGAGKTYTICNSIDPEKNNLILAFTHQNIHNINNELNKKFGKIPDNTLIMTFDSFKFRFIVSPYLPTILSCFNNESIKINGITMKEPPTQGYFSFNRYVPNLYYDKKDKLEHYIYKNKQNVNQFYLERLSELIIFVHKRNKFLNRVINNFNLFFNSIYIDEFQDFREFDYELIELLTPKLNNVTLVGDFYQHSVAAKKNKGKPYEKNPTKELFKSYLASKTINVDDTTLIKTKRCPSAICEFISKKLNIEINADNSNDGKVYFITEPLNIKNILENENIIKLTFKESNKYNFKCINWSYSKGDTYDNVCVILTSKFENIDLDNFKLQDIDQSTINKLYVAFTRTKGNLYVIKESVFKKIKKSYEKIIL